jgi:hypothetical protein
MHISNAARGVIENMGGYMTKRKSAYKHIWKFIY